MTKTKKNQIFTPLYKEEAIKLASSLNNVTQAAKNLGISKSTLNSWIKMDKVKSNPNIGLAETLTQEQEIRKLKKQNARLEIELEIIKKATAYFAKDRLEKNMPKF